MNTDSYTIADYVKDKGITAETVLIGKPTDGQWTDDHRLYSVTLRMGDKALRTDYTCNPFPIRGPRDWYCGDGTLSVYGEGKRNAAKYPERYKADPAEMLDCLVMDAMGTDQPFEDWAADLGYDPDSRKAEAIFHKCRDMAGKLRSFLGAAELERVMYEVERL